MAKTMDKSTRVCITIVTCILLVAGIVLWAGNSTYDVVAENEYTARIIQSDAPQDQSLLSGGLKSTTVLLDNGIQVILPPGTIVNVGDIYYVRTITETRFGVEITRGVEYRWISR